MTKLEETLYKLLPRISMEEFKKYMDEVDNGYINMRYHPEDEDIIILNYSDKVTYERRWNEQTLNARGLILDTSNAINNDYITVLAKPFPKFFNYGENPEYEEGIENWEVESVAEKMDGSLGISYFFNDEIRFATRGSFESEQAIKATEIWKEKYKKYFSMEYYVYNPETLLVEIIYPENRIVVDYGKEEKLVMLSMVRMDSTLPIEEYEYYNVVKIAEGLCMETAKRYFMTIEEMNKKRETISANEEGWVIKFTNSKRLKIKGKEYIDVHRVRHGLSVKAKYKYWAEGKMDDLIFSLPEEFRKELEDFRDKLDRIESDFTKILTYIFNGIPAEYEGKEFAEVVNKVVKNEFRGMLFNAKKTGKISEKLIKEFIFKHYQSIEDRGYLVYD